MVFFVLFFPGSEMNIFFSHEESLLRLVPVSDSHFDVDWAHLHEEHGDIMKRSLWARIRVDSQ